MDTSDPLIVFDENGISNHYHEYNQLLTRWDLQSLIEDQALERNLEKIRQKGRDREFDCIMGLSGGIDSSYVAWLAMTHGLRPLCVHLDNGWNSELAVANIHNIIKTTGFALHTHVINWSEFRDLQRSFFKADVIDLELLTDHAIFGVILQLAHKYKTKYILSGANFATEAVLPKAWVHRKQDLRNIIAIHKKYGTIPMTTFPQVSTLNHVIMMYGLGYQVVKPLNLMSYNVAEAKKILKEKFAWRDYGGKHHESIFTKFYQAHILPQKFGVDKRRAHLSTLILSGQISREDALAEIEKPIYPPQDLAGDKEYIRKKLGFNDSELEDYLKRPPRSHYEFDSDQKIYDALSYGRSRLLMFRAALKGLRERMLS